MKTAIRYLRFSAKGQSASSIERQEVVTDFWIKTQQVQLIDSFADKGKSARTFDRPDYIKLEAFIHKYHRKVDYLLVDQFDRFSRNAAEGLQRVKELQRKFAIQIVSVTEGIIFDYETPGSFFRAGLQLLLAEEDNINRSSKVRSGLYAAVTKEGRYIYKNPPFGYNKTGSGKERRIVVNEEQASVVKFIYDAFLRGVPLYVIKDTAREMGFDRGGSMAIERVLSNPAYAGMLRAKAFKEHPGGIFSGAHEPIVDLTTWKMVQSKKERPAKVRAIMDDEIPLRGVLKCHCGNPLSGAPSRGKSGKYFYYYKCKHSKHNNISAVNSHRQLSGAIGLMSLPEHLVTEIRQRSRFDIECKMKENSQKAEKKKEVLEEVEKKLLAVEEKFITNQIAKDTYERWHSTYTSDIFEIKAAIERYSINYSKAYDIIDKNLSKLSNLEYVYNQATTLQKREFINLVFDNNLYYENGIYRTPTMFDIFTDKCQEMKDLGYLIYEKKRDNLATIPFSGERGIRTLGTVASTTV